jgi:hypothetical protein
MISLRFLKSCAFASEPLDDERKFDIKNGKHRSLANIEQIKGQIFSDKLPVFGAENSVLHVYYSSPYPEGLHKTSKRIFFHFLIIRDHTALRPMALPR